MQNAEIASSKPEKGEAAEVCSVQNCAMGFRRKRRRSRLKSHSTIHKCPQLLAQPQIHFHKWPKLLQLIIIVETLIQLPRMVRQIIPKNKHSQLSISNYDDH